MIESLLGDLAKGTTFLAEVDNETNTATLSTPDTFLNGVDQVWFAGTNVGTEHIRSVT